MSKKKEWRTRKRGTKAQIGTRFPVTSRGDKRKLPSTLKKVFMISEKEREDKRLEMLNARLRNMQKELENDLIQGLPVDNKVLEMNKVVQEIEDIREGSSSLVPSERVVKNDDPYSFANIVAGLKKLRIDDGRIVYETDEIEEEGQT